MRSTVSALVGCAFLLAAGPGPAPLAAQQRSYPGHSTAQSPAVHVDPVNLTAVQESVVSGLNLGAVIALPEVAAGAQKAADVWGLHLDLFVETDPARRVALGVELVRNGVAAFITDDPEVVGDPGFQAAVAEVDAGRGPELGPLPVTLASTGPGASAQPAFDGGFEAVRASRARLLPQIPKYDELFNLAFPISPLPDSFFQPTKFPYPEPVIRSVRTVSSASASAHAHTSCHAAALLGNMIHRTSQLDPEVFLLGFEGGNLSIKAAPGAVSPDKLAAVMTSYVIGLRGNAGERRDLLSENDGLETSVFKPSFHVPEELDLALSRWQAEGLLSSFERQGTDEVVLRGFKGRDRRFRAAFFIISTARRPLEPALELGVDGYGRWVFEMTSTQGFLQLFGEVPLTALTERATSPGAVLSRLTPASPAEAAEIPVVSGITPLAQPLIAPPRTPRGGMLTRAGAMVGSTVGFPLGALLQRVQDASPRFQPYLLAIEGGFLVVTPVQPLTPGQVNAVIERVDVDERGPLGSDQTITVTLAGGAEVLFRRTALNYGYVDQALSVLQEQAWISGWEYVGARGQGLAANVVLHNLLGKHRKFMSSLNTWPSDDRPAEPYLRWYVDGMQRLNFSVVTAEGWRQEFVEVPITIPPIPRDVQLYTGVSRLD